MVPLPGFERDQFDVGRVLLDALRPLPVQLAIVDVMAVDEDNAMHDELGTGTITVDEVLSTLGDREIDLGAGNGKLTVAFTPV